MLYAQIKKINQAVHLLGSQENLAFACKVSQQTVSKWVSNRVKRLRYEHAVAIDKATGGKVPWRALLLIDDPKHAQDEFNAS